MQEAIVRGPGPTAVQTKIGYLLSGPLHNYTSSIASSVFHLSSASLFDSSGITPVESTHFGLSKESSDFLQEYLHNSVSRQSDGTYIVSFPWKSSHPVLPTNKSTCERRVRSLTRKLSNTTGMLKVYHSIIEEN